MTVALDAIECLTVMDELDTEPTTEELNKAINSLASRKAPGSDRITPSPPLHEVLCQCWKEEAVPQDMRDAKIITPYKSKRDRSDCNNYRGISLLGIVGKVFARVILVRLHRFRFHRLHRPHEGVRPCQQGGPFSQSCPRFAAHPSCKALLSPSTATYRGLCSSTAAPRSPSEVKQGCVLAPIFLGIFFILLLKHAFGTSREGIYLRTRSDDRLFNLVRLRAKTKVREALIRDMLFADDAAVATHTQRELQSLMDHFSQVCRDFGLTISLKKTNVLGQGIESPPIITTDEDELDAVHRYTYHCH